MKTEPLFANTYTALAGRLDEDRSAIARALSEPSAPQKTRRGWSVQAVRDFLFIRRLEKNDRCGISGHVSQRRKRAFDAEYFCDADNGRRMLGEIRIKGRIAMIADLRS